MKAIKKAPPKRGLTILRERDRMIIDWWYRHQSGYKLYHSHKGSANMDTKCIILPEKPFPSAAYSGQNRAMNRGHRPDRGIQASDLRDRRCSYVIRQTERLSGARPGRKRAPESVDKRTPSPSNGSHQAAKPPVCFSIGKENKLNKATDKVGSQVRRLNNAM